MRFEVPEFDERKNPNISHEPPFQDVKRMLGYFLAMILALWLMIEVIVLSLPYVISLEQEQRWFKFVGTTLIEDEHTQLDPVLQKIADDLILKMGLPAQSVKVYISQNHQINAYATFGGHIVFYQGLLNQLPNEEAVVAVLAHEMAHIQHRDMLKGSTRNLLFMMVISLMGGDSISGFVAQLEGLRYSRNLEENADKKAVETLNAYYGRVGGMVSAFELFHQMEKEERDATPQWILSHPKTEQRIMIVKTFAQQKGYSLAVGTAKNHWHKPFVTEPPTEK